MLAVDDDEYVVADGGLRAAAMRMLEAGACASWIPWRLYGTSNRVCQPDAALVSAFHTRAPLKLTKAERAVVAAAKADSGAYPVSGRGKVMQLWSPEGKLACGTHMCHGTCDNGGDGARSRKLANCANPRTRTFVRCKATAKTAPWLAHYAIQSLQHWDLKKKRGRTSSATPRTGPPLPLYDAVYDDSPARGLAVAVRRLRRAAPALADCVAGA